MSGFVKTIRTNFVTPSQKISSSASFAKKPSTFTTAATVLNGQISLKTPFVRTGIQKRHYSGPVHIANDNTHIATPPSQQEHYKKDMDTYDEQASRNSAYFLVGTYSFVGAMAAKNLVTGFLANMSASADVLAMSKVEVKLNSIPEGKNVVLKWRGKPVFIRHRTAEGIQLITRNR
jgi:ubiquinol-cytochrome c reductase iron-sulfur subunit